MARPPLPPGPPDDKSPPRIVAFPETANLNRLLLELCGEFDRNLAQIEHQTETQIVRRSDGFEVHGPIPSQDLAEAVLHALFQRAEAGTTIEPGDIDGLIRLGSSSEGTGTRDGDQREMFPTTEIEIKTRKKTVRPRTKVQKAYVESLFKHELCFGIGPAGTGKTYLAVAAGVSMLIAGEIDKIILSRPAVEAGERLGFLPGTQEDKVDPYMQPLYDALNDFLPGKQLDKLKAEKTVEIAPLAFMRGRTLSNAYIVLDEAQNATSMQMKMFLTRLGENSRMVITGDRSQVDLPRGVMSGLRDAERVLAGINGVSFTHFTAEDVVRHPLVAEIIKAYDADAVS